MNISTNHNNRGLHNWLVYNSTDKFLSKYEHFYNGVLYDLGCGEKPYENYFNQFVKNYIGVDWSNTLHNLKADIISDLNKPLNIEDNVADIVISLSVIEHLSTPIVMINEGYRILKSGGVFIIQIPFQWHIHEAPYDFQRFTSFGLKYLFNKSGFQNVTIEPISGFFTMLALKLNYFSLRFIKGPKIIRSFIRLCLIPFWTIDQIIAPVLDILDHNWELETSGYFIVAKKI